MDTAPALPTAPFARPSAILRAEAAALLAANLLLYNYLFPAAWGWFALWFFVPDLSLIPFALPAKRLATTVYNVSHTYALPVLLGFASIYFHWIRTEQFACIWIAHISFDRLLGYGLKYPQSFKLTHIQRSASIGVEG